MTSSSLTPAKITSIWVRSSFSRCEPNSPVVLLTEHAITDGNASLVWLSLLKWWHAVLNHEYISVSAVFQQNQKSSLLSPSCTDIFPRQGRRSFDSRLLFA